ncbi:hypothetical protein FN846DRAFT_966351 [Sphaerosporella brunnea]|uniref:Uncharacterized protein n=1 Tax=Sphaerosporella brunnea TaxID=1250544 RepID=A0A5J5EMZ6_9PEZI|nr:hypothetical protein FN846DRAFT_966351 [Sphaerosporella brunnea]
MRIVVLVFTRRAVSAVILSIAYGVHVNLDVSRVCCAHAAFHTAYQRFLNDHEWAWSRVLAGEASSPLIPPSLSLYLYGSHLPQYKIELYRRCQGQ